MRSLLLVLPISLLAAPASALTPEALWSAWQAQAAGFGVTLQADAVPGPDGSLTLRGFARAMGGGPLEPMPSDSPVQELILSPTGDGAVLIDPGLPDRGLLPGAGGAGGDVWVEQDGLRITARDAEGGIGYEVAAEALRAAPLGPGDRTAQDLAYELSGLRLAFPGQIGPDRSIEVSLSVEGWAYVIDMPDPGFGMGSRQTGRSQGTLALRGAVTVPEGMTAADMDDFDPFAALDRGLAVRLDLRAGESTQATSVEGFPFSYSTEARSGAGTGSLSLDRTGLSAEGEFGGGSLTVSSPDWPVPSFDMTYGPVRAEMRLPMGAEVGEARYFVSFEGLTVGEEAWAMLDPQGLLPREPASLLLDLRGRMSLDLAAMAAAGEAGTPPPVPVVESLEIAGFDVAAAGVRAQGTGSFTFDDATGVPMPLGSGSLRLEGVDRLIDALVAMGWVTDQDAQGARFALAAYFRSGGAPDTRETTFEMREGGALFVNGLPVQ